MQSHKFFALGFIILICGACQDQVVFTKYQSFSEAWSSTDTLNFNFEAPDTIHPHHMFFSTRLNENFEFNNLYLIASISFPNGKRITDTLEYQMAHPDGSLMGSGFGSVKESKLWYKSDVIFIEPGEYQVKIRQAMRRNGEIEAIDALKGVLDFGLHLERAIRVKN